MSDFCFGFSVSPYVLWSDEVSVSREFSCWKSTRVQVRREEKSLPWTMGDSISSRAPLMSGKVDTLTF